MATKNIRVFSYVISLGSYMPLKWMTNIVLLHHFIDKVTEVQQVTMAYLKSFSWKKAALTLEPRVWCIYGYSANWLPSPGLASIPSPGENVL